MVSRKVVIIGAHGQIGTVLQRSAPDWAEIIALSRHDVDLTKPSELRAVLLA